MEILIGNVMQGDAKAIVGALNPIIEAGRYTAFDTPFSVQEERDFINSLRPRAIFHAAEWVDDRRLVGFQTLTPFADYTHVFGHVGVMGTFVDLAYHRRGIAARFFASTFHAAREFNYEKVFAFVRSDNEAGLGVYLSQGFAIIGTARGQAKIRGRYIDEVIIEKWLVG